jgi:chromate transporter
MNGQPTEPIHSDDASSAAAAAEAPTLFELFWQFMIIGAVSFGGGIVAYEKILLTEKKRWLSDDEFMAALAISQTMPGLNAVNLAVLSGDKVRGVWGSVAAVIGLLIPGCSFVLVVGMIYLQNANHPYANMMLAGVAAAATGLLAAITFKIGKRQFSEIKPVVILIATFLLMSIAKLSLPIVLAIMIPIALFMYRPQKRKD